MRWLHDLERASPSASAGGLALCTEESRRPSSRLDKPGRRGDARPLSPSFSRPRDWLDPKRYSPATGSVAGSTVRRYAPSGSASSEALPSRVGGVGIPK